MADKRGDTLRRVGKNTRFKPGNKTGGRKPGSVSVTDSVRRALNTMVTMENPLTEMPETLVARDWVGIVLLAKALKGDVYAIREILDRTDGKTTSKVEVSGKDGKPIGVEHAAGLSEARSRLRAAFNSRSTNNDAGLAKERSLLLDDSGSKS